MRNACWWELDDGGFWLVGFEWTDQLSLPPCPEGIENERRRRTPWKNHRPWRRGFLRFAQEIAERPSFIRCHVVQS